MRHIYITLLLVVVFSCTEKTSNLPTERFEVCIYGGTSAGIISAIQLSKDGRRVAILEPSGHLGGMTTEGLGGSDINNHPNFKNDAAVGGLTLDFYKACTSHYGIINFDSAKHHFMTWRFEPHVADSIFQAWIEAYKVPVFLHTRLDLDTKGVKKEGTDIQSIQTEDGRIFEAEVFIDATYEGDLLYQAGVSTVVGRESNNKYSETKNGIRKDNPYRNFEVQVDPYVVKGDSTSGVIHTVQHEYYDSLEHGLGDERIQAFCIRACLTKDSANRIPFTKPENYHRDWYEIYLRYQQAGGNLYGPYYSIPNQKTDLGAWHDLSHNLYGMNHAYPSGNYRTRDSIYQYHLDFTKGLFWFLANDTAVDASTRKKWNEWGTTKDEFQNNDGWPSKIYIRDGRRMVSDFVHSEHHTRKDTVVEIPKPVGVAYWPPDVHHVRRIIKEGYVYNEGFVFGGEAWKPFSISYDALVPKCSECTNILTPTCPSSSHIAYGAIRLEWTFMALGQSVASAAQMALEEKKDVQEIDYPSLRQLLLAQNQILEL